MKFELGQVVATRNAVDTISALYRTVALNKYANGDWGITCEEDAKSNEEAILTGEDRIFATYKDPNGVTFYIITEHDRSVTTILLPEDY